MGAQIKNRGAPAERLRDLRKLLGLTQEDVANRGQIGRDRVVHAERGRSRFTSYWFRLALAHGLGVTLETLSALLEGRLKPEQAARKSSLREDAA